jgi:hypothetical protein
MVLRGLIKFPSAPPGGASSPGRSARVNARPVCGSRRGWPLPQTGPRYGRHGGPVRVRNGLAKGISHPLFAVPLSSGRTGQAAESRSRNGHGCQRPSCGHGSGPTGNCMPEMPDCDQPRRTSRLPCSIESGGSWIELSRSERLSASVSALYIQEQWVCAHAETRPALTQVVSQKRRKLRCRFLDNVPETKQSRTTAQRRRCGESARIFAVAFRRKLRRSRSA